MTKMTIAFGADHAGYELKQKLITEAKALGYGTMDFGTDNTEPCDYPVVVPPVVDALRTHAAQYGVLVCGSGTGVDIVANRHRGMRSALCYSTEMAKLAREHEDANILSLGGRLTDHELAKEIMKTFLTTPFTNEERHVRRIGMLDKFM